MNVGFVGVGKLGMPCALAIDMAGHNVFCYDVNPKNMQKERFPHREIGPNGEPSIEPLLQKSNLNFTDLTDVVKKSEIIFVAVQTPHDPRYEGITRIPDERMDFDYTYLVDCIKNLSKIVDENGEEKIVIIISTVLPGTVRKHIFPVMSDKIKLCYNPFFIAMGTTMRDFLNPEFVLFGVHDESAAEKAEKFYKTLHDRPLYKTSIENAEAIKVFYNTFISSKISIANTIMEMSHKLPGCNCDEITDALKMATDRLISAKYLSGGMGDGGGCFPPNSRILTENGFREISTIEEGDLVLTAKGRLKPVKKIWTREYEGDLIFVKTKGCLGEWMTEDHPVVAAKDGRKIYPNKKRNTINSISEKLEKDEEVLASELCSNYLIPFPKYNGNPIEKPDYATDEYIELAGWWLSEGSAELNSRRGRIRFDLHEKEREYGKRIEFLLDKCKVENKSDRGSNAKITSSVNGNRRCVRFGNMGLAKRLVNDFGKGAANKFIPSWILFGSEKTMELVLKGLLLGDGHCCRDRISLETISRDLYEGLFFILNRLGYSPRVHHKKARGIHKECWSVSVSSFNNLKELATKVGYDVDIIEESSSYSKFEAHGYRDGSTYRRVVKIESEEYNGPVYNLWVDDDNTFVVSCGSVHNCHPRDNIALSWLSRELDMSFDWFEAAMMQREKQTEWLADLIIEQKEKNPELPIVILGKAFKPETNLTVGSPSILLKNILEEKGYSTEMYDPYVDEDSLDCEELMGAAIYFLGTNHKCFETWDYPSGSVVIDTFRSLKNQKNNVKVIPVGIGE